MCKNPYYVAIQHSKYYGHASYWTFMSRLQIERFNEIVINVIQSIQKLSILLSYLAHQDFIVTSFCECNMYYVINADTPSWDRIRISITQRCPLEKYLLISALAIMRGLYAKAFTIGDYLKQHWNRGIDN